MNKLEKALNRIKNDCFDQIDISKPFAYSRCTAKFIKESFMYYVNAYKNGDVERSTIVFIILIILAYLICGTCLIIQMVLDLFKWIKSIVVNLFKIFKPCTK